MASDQDRLNDKPVDTDTQRVSTFAPKVSAPRAGAPLPPIPAGSAALPD